MVYIQGGNVFIAGVDGSNPHQVTTDGKVTSGASLSDPGSDSTAYHSPTEADDGSIWAAMGFALYHYNQNGTLIKEVVPPGGEYPLAAAVSPDDTKVAYNWDIPAVGSGGDLGGADRVKRDHGERGRRRLPRRDAGRGRQLAERQLDRDLRHRQDLRQRHVDHGRRLPDARRGDAGVVRARGPARRARGTGCGRQRDLLPPTSRWSIRPGIIWRSSRSPATQRRRNDSSCRSTH